MKECVVYGFEENRLALREEVKVLDSRLTGIVTDDLRLVHNLTEGGKNGWYIETLQIIRLLGFIRDRHFSMRWLSSDEG